MTDRVYVTHRDRDDLYEVIPYCSECANETGDSGLGYCDEHMDPVLDEIIRRHRADAQAILLDELAIALDEEDLPKSAATLRRGAAQIRGSVS